MSADASKSREGGEARMPDKSRFKSFEEVWRLHKDLLRSSGVPLSIDWKRELPDDPTAYELLRRKGDQWLNPREPLLIVTESYARALADRLRPQLEDVWGHGLREMPSIEVVPPERFMERIDHYQGLTNREFGSGMEIMSPPVMLCASDHRLILLPSSFVMREQRGPLGRGAFELASLTSIDFDCITMPWDKTYFEQMFAVMLSSSLFRQARGEWGADYVRTMKSLGPSGEKYVSSIFEASAQLATERMCAQRPEWGFYVAVEAITTIWNNRHILVDYMGLDALCQDMKLMRAALVDQIGFRGKDDMVVGFLESHPNGPEKERAFWKGT